MFKDSKRERRKLLEENRTEKKQNPKPYVSILETAALESEKEGFFWKTTKNDTASRIQGNFPNQAWTDPIVAVDPMKIEFEGIIKAVKVRQWDNLLSNLISL